jgi:hypothetical protein
VGVVAGGSQSVRSGAWLRPSASGLTHSTWWSWIWLRSNLIRDPTR